MNFFFFSSPKTFLEHILLYLNSIGEKFRRQTAINFAQVANEEPVIVEADEQST